MKTAIAAALLYDNPDDPQAVELAQALKAGGIDQVLEEISNLPSDHPLARLVKEKLPEVEKLRQEEK